MLLLIISIIILLTTIGLIPTMRLRRLMSIATRGTKEIVMAIVFACIAILVIYLAISSIILNSAH